jgi:transcriptional/translational regulatory protein YebC/TACO1
MGEAGSVAWMFERKGVITLPRQGKTEDDMMEIVLDAGADDLQTEDDIFVVQTSLESFEPVRRALIDKKLTVENASLQWVAKNNISVGGEEAEKILKLIELLEDNDDVQNVFTNADIDEASIQ